MLDKVVSIISEYQDIPADTIHADSHLVNDLGFTSYDVVSLVGKFEDEFDIEVPDRKIKHTKTVDDIVKFLEAVTEE
jgi:acyl carrier protein